MRAREVAMTPSGAAKFRMGRLCFSARRASDSAGAAGERR